METPQSTSDEKTSKPKTTQQVRALYLSFDHIARDMNSLGHDQKVIMERLNGFESPVTDEFIKQVYKSIVFTMYRKTSIAQLTTYELQQAFDVLNKFLGQEFGYHAIFPNIEDLLHAQIADTL